MQWSSKSNMFIREFTQDMIWDVEYWAQFDKNMFEAVYYMLRLVMDERYVLREFSWNRQVRAFVFSLKDCLH